MSWNRRVELWLIGLIIGFLTLCLIGCGAAPRTVIKTKVEPVLPPKQWTEPIERPRLSGVHNRDLALLIKRQAKTIERYEVRLSKFRRWWKDHAE